MDPQATLSPKASETDPIALSIAEGRPFVVKAHLRPQGYGTNTSYARQMANLDRKTL